MYLLVGAVGSVCLPAQWGAACCLWINGTEGAAVLSTSGKLINEERHKLQIGDFTWEVWPKVNKQDSWRWGVQAGETDKGEPRSACLAPMVWKRLQNWIESQEKFRGKEESKKKHHHHHYPAPATHHSVHDKDPMHVITQEVLDNIHHALYPPSYTFFLFKASNEPTDSGKVIFSF